MDPSSKVAGDGAVEKWSKRWEGRVKKIRLTLIIAYDVYLLHIFFDAPCFWMVCLCAFVLKVSRKARKGKVRAQRIQRASL
jgi:hypothetical protein